MCSRSEEGGGSMSHELVRGGITCGNVCARGAGISCLAYITLLGYFFKVGGGGVGRGGGQSFVQTNAPPFQMKPVS